MTARNAKGERDKRGTMAAPEIANPGNVIDLDKAARTAAMTRRNKDGQRQDSVYHDPKIANPGNVVECGAAGGGNMGSALAHEGHAPFPEYLAEFFIRSFCPPGGTVLDPFSGSGTTAAAAMKAGRRFLVVDVRESETALTSRRVAEAAFRRGFGF